MLIFGDILRTTSIVRLSDWTCARHNLRQSTIHGKMDPRVAMNVYASPEDILNYSTITTQSDWYSFGCIICFIFSGVHPWQNRHLDEIQYRMRRYKMGPLHVVRGLEELKYMPLSIFHLMVKCLQTRPDKRPATKDIIQTLDEAWNDCMNSVCPISTKTTIAPSPTLVYSIADIEKELKEYSERTIMIETHIAAGIKTVPSPEISFHSTTSKDLKTNS